MEEDGKEKGLQSLINKINHPLSEVRGRSLRNILFKVQNNLISVSELVSDKFLRHLLEWFNHPECSHESHVLELIDKLIVQHENAAQMLLEMGGVEFLSQLRLHSHESLHSLIDTILDHMLNLREMSIVQLGSVTNEQSSNNSSNDVIPVTTAPLTSSVNVTLSAQSFVTETTTLSGISLRSLTQLQDCETQTSQPLLLDEVTRGTGGAGTTAHDDGAVRQEFIVTNPPPVSLHNNGLVLPWIILSRNDQHILFTTDGRLQNSDESFVVSSCEFICEVLLQDFPPELFLQRPLIAKSLVKLVSLNGSVTIASKALECLCELTAGLQCRLAILHDPSMTHTDSVTSFVAYLAATTSQQHPNPSGEELVALLGDLEDTDDDKMKQLQADQLRLDQYCHLIVNHCVSVLFDLLNKEELADSRGSCDVTDLLCGLLRLLHTTTELLGKVFFYQKLDNTSELLNPVQVTLKQSLTGIVEVIVQCMSKWKRKLHSENRTVSCQGVRGGGGGQLLSTTCTVLIHAAWCFSEILRLQVDANNCTDSLPDNGVMIIRDIVLNGFFYLCCPHIVSTLLPYFKHIDKKGYDIYHQAEEMRTAFVKAKNFLDLSADTSLIQQLMEAIECLPSVLFSLGDRNIIVETCMKLCLTCDRNVVPLLLQLLSYPCDNVKILAYTHLEQFLTSKDTTAESLSKFLTLLVDFDILEELVCFGLDNAVTKIANLSQSIIIHLMKMTIQSCSIDVSITDKLFTKLSMFLPYLEAGLCNEESGQEMLKSFILHESKAGLTQNQKILCSLRLMLSSVSALRVWGLSLLSKQLVSDHTANKKSPFSSVSDSLLHDVLVCATPPSGEHKVGTQCALNRKDVSKLTQLLASKSLDTPLKKSSLQQLYIVLQDYTLHDAAIEAGVVDHLLFILTNQLKHNKDDTNTTNDDLPLLSSCVGCLRLLAHTSTSLRSRLASDSVFLMDALRGALLAQADKVLRYNTSKLLFYVLYNNVAVYTHPAVGSGVAIPHQILAKLQLPYDVTPTHPVSKHAITPVMSASQLDDQAISNMLRVYQQISAYSSVFDLTQHPQNNNTVALLSAPEMAVLASMDRVSMAWRCVIELENASTHQEVAKCLDRVSIALTSLSLSELPADAVEKLKQILGRFLTTAPISSNDCDLFCHILLFCLHTFILTAPPKVTNEMDQNSFNAWLCELTTAENCTCLQLLSCTPETSSIEEFDIIRVQKTVMKFYSNLLAQAPACLFKGPFCVQLMDTLCCRLNMAGSPSYYDLPFLEISLNCLLHLTSLPLTTVSSQVMTLYMKLAVSLRQVLWSFISGRGETFASFMGKGVTLQASVSLCHLMYGVTLLERGDKLSVEWVASSPPDVGLSWINSLVQDRVAQVRYAGYTLMGVLCTHQNGMEALLTECQAVMPAGLWSLCTQTLLNNQECGMVRGKAGEVLLQLLKCCQSCDKWENFVTFSTQEGTLLGLEALHALMQHCNIVVFLQETLTSLFADSAVFNSVTDDGDSNIFTDYHGIRQLTATVAPYFISSTCRILHNLVILLSDPFLSSLHHSGVDTLLLRFLDNQLLLYVVKSSIHSQSVALLSSWVLMLADVATLLCTLVQYSPQLFLTSVAKEKHLHSLFKLLTITSNYSTDQIVYRELLPLCKEVMLLLCTSGRLLGNSDCGETFFTAAHFHWNTITVTTKQSLTDEREGLSMACLGLLNLVLSQWFKPSGHRGSPVDTAYREARLVSLEKKMENSETTCASDLCTALLSSYDNNMLHCRSGHKNWTRKCLFSHTLAVLLASSDSAKTTALKAGLMESSVEVLRNLHTKLCMESLDGGKKKTSPLVSEAIQAVQLVRNFMYHSEMVKLAAIQCHLSAAVHKLWPWCIIDQCLLASVLLMLGTFTAHCTKACLSLCSLTCGSTSLMQSVMKQATRTVSSYQSPLASRKQHGRHSTVLTAVFSLLANTTVSAECRGLMRKFSFLDLFSTLRPKAESAIPGRCLLFSCWLQLLINLTKYNDGQQMVLKQPDVLELIVELWQFSNDKGVRSQATLLTRNLCFYGPTKTLLASNENFLTLLQSGLRSQEVEDVAMVSSAVWALLSGCRKVRASLKKSPLGELLRQSYTTLQDSGAEDHKKCLHYVSQAMKLLE